MIGLFGRQEGPDELANPLRDFRHKARRLVTHALIAVIGCMMLGFILIDILHIRPHGPHYFVMRFFSDVPYSPAFWGSALAAGFLRTKARDTLALKLGPVATCLFALLILISIPEYLHSSYQRAQSNASYTTYIWGQYFSVDPNKCPGDECLGKLIFTAPVLNCIAYSVGAWFALRWKKQAD